MKTDSLFYRLFQTAPEILLELVGQPANEAVGYTFASVELKQTALRIDGILIPDEIPQQRPVYFVEVQFQRDEGLYHRLFTELMFYLKQHPDTANGRAIIIYPKRGLEPERQDLHRELLEGDRVSQIYLEDLAELPVSSLGLELARLIVESPEQAIDKAKELLARASQESLERLSTADVIDLIETIIVYKFKNLSREEIEVMLGLAELKQTKVYQEALEEGREEGREEGLQQERRVILERLLHRNFEGLGEELRDKIPDLIALPSDRFLVIVVALSQPREFWASAIVSILQARFESVPEGLEAILNAIADTDQRRLETLRNAILVTSSEAFSNFLTVAKPEA